MLWKWMLQRLTSSFILVVINMFRLFPAHIAGLPFPSGKRQTRNVKTGLKGIMESEHLYDIGYKPCTLLMEDMWHNRKDHVYLHAVLTLLGLYCTRTTVVIGRSVRTLYS